MLTRGIGIFTYSDAISELMQDKLPMPMKLISGTHEAILIRLLLGHFKLQKGLSPFVSLKYNFMKLPYKNSGKFTFKSINEAFNSVYGNVDIVGDGELYEKYLNLNRKNHNIYEKVLFEISHYFSCKSSIESFAHLYRCIEYLAYSFPMVYASKSRDYKGTFNDLKDFFKGENASELKFFNKFLIVLFADEESTMDFVFDIALNMTEPIDRLERDCKAIYGKFPYEIEESVLKIKFKNMFDFIINKRNRYFHMLVGQGQNNFESTDYDINEYFESINPYLLNWLSIVIQKISTHGLNSIISLS